MRSLVKMYDMYKAGEYIKEFSDEKMQYLKALDEIPEDTRKKLIRLDDRIAKKHQVDIILSLVLAGLIGLLLGYMISDINHSFEIIKEMLVNTTGV